MLRVDTWPLFVSLYMESLRKLKTLSLGSSNPWYDSQDNTQYDTENYLATLQSLEQLVLQGRPLIHHLRTPSLLSMWLEPSAPIAHLERLDASSLRKTYHPSKGERKLYSQLIELSCSIRTSFGDV